MRSVSLSSFCENCQKFQIERLFGVTNAGNIGSTNLDNGNYLANLVPGGCGLCDFFMECLPERCKVRNTDGTWSICMNPASDPDAREPAQVEVCCFPPESEEGILGALEMTVFSDRISFGNEDVEVSPFLCVSLGGSQSHKLQVPAPSLELAPISDWLDKERRTQQARWYNGKDASLALTVIDCATRTLVPLPTEELYASLSYVWGRTVQPPLDNTNGNPLPLNLPNTIQDSIDVCIALRIRYLWVDRYCISTESSHLRSRQIRRMDEVYQNSFLTIVACAGNDPNSGLPGISRRRNPNPSIEIAGLGCIGALSQYIDIHSGIWATRAWTYQEALLSQRQIYFTDKETFFGSAEGVQGEIEAASKASLEQSLPELLRTEYPFLEQSLPASLRTEYPFLETIPIRQDRNLEKHSLGRLHIWECISDYSTRTLSYQSDILNALLGILAYYRREHGICHLWGIPFSTSVPAPVPSTFLDFELGLRWIVNGPPSRREGFPSWSWTGCNARVQYLGINRQTLYHVPMTKEEAIDVEVELSSGRLVKWSDYQADYANLQDYSRAYSPNEDADGPSRFIHLEALTSRIVANQQGNGNIHYYSIDASTIAPDMMEYFSSVESPSRTNSNAQLEESLPVGSYLALHFPQLDNSSLRGGFDGQPHYLFWNDGCALLIRNFGDHWERVCLLGRRRSLKREEVHKVRRKIRLG